MAAGRKCCQHDKTLHVVMYSKRNIVLNLYVGFGRIINTLLKHYLITSDGDRGSTVVKVLCYKSKGRWIDPSRCQWMFH